MENIKLAKVVKYDGEEIKEINLDFDSLTGQDLLNAEKEAIALNKNASPIKEFDKGYLSIVAAKAAGISTDIMPLLGAKDFTKVTVQAQNFLLNEE